MMWALFQMALAPLRVPAANVMNYGADGNDYFQFSNPSMACDKASGFTTLITFAMHVNADGTLLIAGVACSNGIYVGPTNWNALINTLKTPPTTVTRYEVCIGGWMDTSYDNIKTLVAAQGAGASSILYKNFQALKNAVPGIDAINDDDEQTYDVGSSTSFANMLGGLGYKFTMAPYTAQGFWVSLRNNITNCDAIYLQCYEGGAGNDPGQWNAAFGHGVVVIPGQESNTASEANFHTWYLEAGVQGGFYYPDVVFNATYWSASVYEACGVVPAAPSGLVVIPGGKQAILTWNTAPGAMSYNVKRATSTGAETTVASVSATANNWPASNEYTDIGLGSGTTYYYKISAVNTNGESPNSTEVSTTPQAGIISNPSFEFDATAPGTTVPALPAGWTAFNPGGAGGIGSQNAGGVDFTVNNPLAAPAAGNQYCYINMFNAGVTGGIYQDVGPLQSNTIYSLTVAIGSRADRNNSSGIISLINGTNNAGTVLASGGGLPATQNTWQNYTVTFTTGASVSGDLTLMLSAIGSGTIQADFDNVRLTVTPIPLTPPATPVTVNNFSFESNVAANGADIPTVPTGWTDFNKAFVDDRGTGHPNGIQYTANNPLGAPAAGNQYCWVNVFSATPVGGVYQDTGPLRSNTVYTLTVAIGSRKDRINSPGIISLVNGANNNGAVLASGGGLSATQDTWRDYSVTYITGATVSGDLTILLSVIGNDSTIQADFDNVRLTKAPLFFTAPVLGAAKMAGGNLILTGTNGTPNSGYTWLVTTNLAAPVWQTNSTGTLDANGAFSNSLPMNLAGQAGFFRLRVP
ncbi:MAG TPA: fibronectin type III domain-containing protein [Candidatus Acidoferrales bacterium]|nr:fibronectin type III domain-containing protein [Candidatus Acidoferrales bacterium]